MDLKYAGSILKNVGSGTLRFLKAKQGVAKAKRRKLIEKIIKISQFLGKESWEKESPFGANSDKLYCQEGDLEIACDRDTAHSLYSTCFSSRGFYKPIRDYKITGPSHPEDAERAIKEGLICSSLGAVYKGKTVFAVFDYNPPMYDCFGGPSKRLKKGELFIGVYKPGEWEEVLNNLYNGEIVQNGIKGENEQEKERKRAKQQEKLESIITYGQNLRESF